MRYIFMAVLIALFATSVRAQDVVLGAGVVCDTPAQLEQLYADKGDIEARLKLVNGNIRPLPCAFVHVAFVKGEEIKKLTIDEGFVHVTRVTVVGYHNGTGWVKIEMAEQYIAILEKAEGV